MGWHAAVPVLFAAVFVGTFTTCYALSRKHKLVRTRTPLLCDTGSKPPARLAFALGFSLDGLLLVAAALLQYDLHDTARPRGVRLAAAACACASAVALCGMAWFDVDRFPRAHNGFVYGFITFGMAYMSIWNTISGSLGGGAWFLVAWVGGGNLAVLSLVKAAQRARRRLRTISADLQARAAAAAAADSSDEEAPAPSDGEGGAAEVAGMAAWGGGKLRWESGDSTVMGYSGAALDCHRDAPAGGEGEPPEGVVELSVLTEKPPQHFPPPPPSPPSGSKGGEGADGARQAESARREVRRLMGMAGLMQYSVMLAIVVYVVLLTPDFLEY